jgi:hypothetical protein
MPAKPQQQYVEDEEDEYEEYEEEVDEGGMPQLMSRMGGYFLS